MTTRPLPDGLKLRGARESDAAGVRELLAEVGLPSGDVEAVDGRFIVATDADDVVLGCVALDGRGAELLLRSLAVRESRRGAGLGRLLVDAALLDAWGRRARRVILVTETAADFFAGIGFVPTSRDRVGPSLRDHPQFNGMCPTSATVMELDLTLFA